MSFQSARGVLKMVIILNATSKVDILATVAKLLDRKVYFLPKKRQNSTMSTSYEHLFQGFRFCQFAFDFIAQRGVLPCFIFKKRRFVYQTTGFLGRKTTFVLEKIGFILRGLFFVDIGRRSGNFESFPNVESP